MKLPRVLPVLLPVLAAASGCAPQVGLETAPPVAAESWSVADAPGSFATTSLADAIAVAELQTLTAAALNSNSDIRIAAAKVRQARALAQIARKAALPSISASAGASKTASSAGSTTASSTFAYGQLDVELDLDLFGRLAASRRAAVARSAAAELQRQSIALAVETDVAATYVQRAALLQRVVILDRNIERAADLERIIQARLRAGDATRVDLGQQTVQVRNYQNDRVQLLQALDLTRTALALLTGAEAPQFRMAGTDLRSLAIPDYSADLPAVLLAHRPDVRASEALIAAANGDVAQARASFMPRLNLSARGLLSSTLSAGPLSQSLSLGSSLLLPIFDRGRLRGELDFVTAAQAEAVDRYRKTILEALTEVENIRSAIIYTREREALLNSVVEEARVTARLLRLQYIEGDEGLQRVLDAEQSLGAAEDAQARAREDRLLANIALYRAMGGMTQRTSVGP